MKKKRQLKQKEISLIKGGHAFYITLLICLVVFITAITLLIASFNRLISTHDQNLSGEICVLLSEKMNSSISSMTNSAADVASVISAQKESSPEKIYTLLKENPDKNYLSAGLLDDSGKLYATDAEAAEFQKWQLRETASLADPVSMTMPYRSTLYGQPVVSVFSRLSYGGEQEGYLFFTYPLSDLQKLATTAVLENDIEIWLMNASSANIIQCAGADAHAVGSWTNAYLAMQNIDSKDRNTYRLWISEVRKGEDKVGISYSIEDTFYSQFCSKLESMPGWYVVVRLPSHALSATMNSFRNNVLYFLAVLLLVMIFLIANLYLRSQRENEMLNKLSIHDPLTGALNRRAFEFAAEQRLTRGPDAALIFFDIDFFKQVNDRFGHDAGDKLLVAFSQALQKNFAETGILSRFGGDEFVVLADLESKDALSAILAKAKEDVHAITIDDSKTDSTGFTISFSAGAACFPQDAGDLNGLKQCADAALYKVKESTRDDYKWFEAGKN
ncbi:MAG: sensor domain-containing diguanylate cyclase [Lachnospiraceae bacterium]|nr:sensor domain-containing diguanylate cyclase [Lachnospiraceae bacterium]